MEPALHSCGKLAIRHRPEKCSSRWCSRLVKGKPAGLRGGLDQMVAECGYSSVHTGGKANRRSATLPEKGTLSWR